MIEYDNIKFSFVGLSISEVTFLNLSPLPSGIPFGKIHSKFNVTFSLFPASRNSETSMAISDFWPNVETQIRWLTSLHFIWLLKFELNCEYPVVWKQRSINSIIIDVWQKISCLIQSNLFLKTLLIKFSKSIMARLARKYILNLSYSRQL